MASFPFRSTRIIVVLRKKRIKTSSASCKTSKIQTIMTLTRKTMNERRTLELKKSGGTSNSIGCNQFIIVLEITNSV